MGLTLQPTHVEVFDLAVDALHPVAVIRRRLVTVEHDDGTVEHVPVYRVEPEGGRAVSGAGVDFVTFEDACAALGV